MASESSAADQSIDEHAEEKKVGGVNKYIDGEEIIFLPKEAAGKEEAVNSKEEGLTGMASTASVSEEKHEPNDVSVSDKTNKKEQYEKVGEVENFLQESEVSNSSVPAVEINEGNLQNKADDGNEAPSEVQENSSDFVETFASQELVISESKTEELKDTGIKPTFENERKPEEAPLVSTGVFISEDENVEAETQEVANSESSKDKVSIELIKSENPKDEIQVLVTSEIPTVVVPNASEVPEKNDIDSGNPTSVEVPVKDLEVESGFPEEQKSKESTGTKEPSSNVSTIDAGGEVVVSSSYEVKPSEVAEVVEKKADGLEVETIQTSVQNQDDIEAIPELAQAQFDENVSEGVEVKKDDEIFEGGIETSAVSDGVLSLAEVSSEEEKSSAPAIVVEEKADETYLEGENIDTVPKVAEVTLEGGNVLEGDKLVDKEKVGNSEAIEGNLVDTVKDLTEAEVSSDEVKAPTTTEIVKEALDVTSKELNIAPETSEVFYDGDKLSVGDGKNESMKGEATDLEEASKDITTAEELFDQVIEEKNSESSISETQVPSEDNLVNKEKDVNEEANEMNLQSQADGADETQSAVQSDFIETSTSQEPVFLESQNEDLRDTVIKPTSENEKRSAEAPLVSTDVDISKDGNVVAVTQEAANPESTKDKVDIELIKSEDSKDEIQVLVPDQIPTVIVPDASETPERNDVDSSNLTSIEVPVKDLEVESGSPEEQKLKEGAETKVPSSNVSTIDAGSEVVGSSSYEIKPSGVAELVEKKDDGLEVETVETSVKIHDDLEAKPELAQTESGENISQGVVVKKDDEIVRGGIETSTVPDDVLPFAKVSSEEEKTSEPCVLVEEGATSLESDKIDTVPKVAQVSLEGGNVLEGDKLVDKEKVVNTEVVDRDLVDTFTAPAKAKVSSDQVKAPTTTEIVNEALEVKSKELNIAPEASEVPAEVDNVSVDDEEKSESFKGGDATSSYIISVKESLDQLVEEKKSVSSVSEMRGPAEEKFVDKEKYANVEDEERDFVNTSTDTSVAEVSSKKLKDLEIVEEIDKHSLEEASKELNIASEASEIPSKGDKLSAGEKSESLEGEAATLLEALKDITTAQESLDQVIEEKKSESSTSETQAPSVDKLVEKEKYENGEAKEIYLQNQADRTHETLRFVQSDFVETSAFQESLYSESKTEDLKDIEIKPTSENKRKQGEAPLVSTSADISEDRNVKAVTQESENLEFSKDKVNKELIKSEDSKDEIQVFVPAESSTVALPDASEAPEKNDVNSSIEVPTKDLGVEFGSPEEQKPKESTETNEASLNVSTADAGGEVVGSSYEANPSGNAEVVEKKDEDLEVETSVRTHENIKVKPELAQTQSDENVSEGVEVKKDDEIIEGGIETSTVPDDVPPLSTASSEEEKASEPGVVDEEVDETSLKCDDIGIVAEASLKGRDVLEGNKLVDKEKVMNAEAVERYLVDTFIDPTDAEISYDQVKTPATTEIVKEESDKEALEMTSKELIISPEADEVPSEVDTISTGDEGNSGRLIVGDATLVEAPKDIIAIKESLDQLVQEKTESSVSEMEAQTEDKLVDKEKIVNVENEDGDLINTSTYATAAEVSSEQVKAPEIVEEESTEKALEETSKELNIAPEASEVPSKDDKLYAGEEKVESLKGEAATSVEQPKDITSVEESLVRVIEEKKNENSESGTEALAEDKLVDKEKNVNEEAEERDLVDTSADPTSAVVSSDQVKASENSEIIEKSNKKTLEVPSEGNEVSSGDEEKGEILKGEGATLVEAPKDITIAEESSDQVIKQKSEGSTSEMEALAEDKLVDKEKDVNAVDEKTNLVSTSTDPSEAEVFSEQLKATENAEILNESDKETLELKSKELNIVPVAVEVPSEGDNVSSGEAERSESLKAEDATLLEAPKDITAAEKSIDQLIEENKSESSKNETQAPIEATRDFDTSKLFPETVKEIIASEAVEEKQNQTSNDLSVEEKKANDSEDKMVEVKTEGVLQNVIDKPELEELGAENAENEKSKDQDSIVSSDSSDVKLTKEVTKRESNIFSKVKRSIVKAKKAILGKSPGPKTLSSEAKDEKPK